MGQRLLLHLDTENDDILRTHLAKFPDQTKRKKCMAYLCKASSQAEDGTAVTTHTTEFKYSRNSVKVIKMLEASENEEAEFKRVRSFLSSPSPLLC